MKLYLKECAETLRVDFFHKHLKYIFCRKGDCFMCLTLHALCFFERILFEFLLQIVHQKEIYHNEIIWINIPWNHLSSINKLIISNNILHITLIIFHLIIYNTSTYKLSLKFSCNIFMSHHCISVFSLSLWNVVPPAPRKYGDCRNDNRFLPLCKFELVEHNISLIKYPRNWRNQE